MNILCLDLGTTTGVAWGDVERGDPATCLWDLREAGPGRPARFLHLARLLKGNLRRLSIERVYYEAPMPLSAMMRLGAREETLAFLRGLSAIVEVCAADAKLPVGTWRVQEARAAVLGRARGWTKAEVITQVRLLGYPVDNDNEADAVIGYLWRRGAPMPLFEMSVHNSTGEPLRRRPDRAYFYS